MATHAGSIFGPRKITSKFSTSDRELQGQRSVIVEVPAVPAFLGKSSWRSLGKSS